MVFGDIAVDHMHIGMAQAVVQRLHTVKVHCTVTEEALVQVQWKICMHSRCQTLCLSYRMANLPGQAFEEVVERHMTCSFA